MWAILHGSSVFSFAKINKINSLIQVQYELSIKVGDFDESGFPNWMDLADFHVKKSSGRDRNRVDLTGYNNWWRFSTIFITKSLQSCPCFVTVIHPGFVTEIRLNRYETFACTNIYRIWSKFNIFRIQMSLFYWILVNFMNYGFSDFWSFWSLACSILCSI